MKNRTRHRALRVLSGAIITSDFSLSEITELEHALRKDSEFSHQLAVLLEHVGRSIESPRGAKKSLHLASRKNREEDTVVDEIMTVLKRRRASKKEIIAWLRKGSDNKMAMLDPNQTLHEIVATYVSLASENELERVLFELGTRDETMDPYLRGIMRKRKEYRL